MQEEVENRTLTLVVSGTKFTGRLLKAAISKYLAHRKEKKLQKQRSRDAPVKPQGKQTGGRILNSKKVSDHHAIIPTSEFAKQGFTGLAESECKLMNLVCSKLLCAIAVPYEYETVTAVFSCAGNEFTAKGKTVLILGWKEIDQRFRATLKADTEEEVLNALPELAEGQSFSVTANVSEHFTSPPKAYTEDTLLSAMERAGAEDMPENAERKGLGTPATRAAILEKLVQMGFVQRKGKQLVPTKDGINL